MTELTLLNRTEELKYCIDAMLMNIRELEDYTHKRILCLEIEIAKINESLKLFNVK